MKSFEPYATIDLAINALVLYANEFSLPDGTLSYPFFFKLDMIFCISSSLRVLCSSINLGSAKSADNLYLYLASNSFTINSLVFGDNAPSLSDGGFIGNLP